MIVLVVLGVLAGILIPIAANSGPDKNIVKFKKADETLKSVIQQLVEGDKYYCNGDLGIKADCATNLTNDSGIRNYFCQTIADLLTTKKVSCSTATNGTGSQYLLSNEELAYIATGSQMKRTVTPETIQATKEKFDSYCKSRAIFMGQEIITTDDIVYYSAGPNGFGSANVSPNAQNGLTAGIKLRYFSPPDQHPANYGDQNGFDIAYKIFCIDVDGFDESVGSESCDDKGDICPFGYGIRADGKILPGARAEEWIAKSMHKKDKEDED